MQMDIFLIPHFSFTMFPACGLRGGEGPGAWGLGPVGLWAGGAGGQKLPRTVLAAVFVPRNQLACLPYGAGSATV